MRRASLCLVVVAALVAAPAQALAGDRWKARIDDLLGRRAIGVEVRHNGRRLYTHRARRKRVPASNQKLLLSMALFDELSPSKHIPLRAANDGLVAGGVLRGNLYLQGRGDPAVTNGGRWARSLPFRVSGLWRLARRIENAGIDRIEGRVVGSTGYFARDWFAPGWKSYFDEQYVPLPTALTFNRNTYEGRHISNPEVRAARALTKRLETRGVAVTRRAAMGPAPGGLSLVARLRSARLATLVRYMNRRSDNFFAEVLGKALGAAVYGRPGTIAKGAAAVRAWAAVANVGIVARDSSGLSYENRVSPRGMTKLLALAAGESWGGTLRRGLPKGNQGTLDERLGGVPVRAKTGTLQNISALSGWVWLRRRGAWAEFSIMSRGMSKTTAARLEDRVVRIVNRYGS